MREGEWIRQPAWGTIHPSRQCAGQYCVIHNPSPHHMRGWPKNLRETTLVERICPHGVGHPDPDSLAFFQRVGKPGMRFHGCCEEGCCHMPAWPLLNPYKKKGA